MQRNFGGPNQRAERPRGDNEAPTRRHWRQRGETSANLPNARGAHEAPASRHGRQEGENSADPPIYFVREIRKITYMQPLLWLPDVARASA